MTLGPLSAWWDCARQASRDGWLYGRADLPNAPERLPSAPSPVTPPEGKDTRLSESRPSTQNEGALKDRGSHTHRGGPPAFPEETTSSRLGSCLPQCPGAHTDQPSQGASPLPRLQAILHSLSLPDGISPYRHDILAPAIGPGGDLPPSAPTTHKPAPHFAGPNCSHSTKSVPGPVWPVTTELSCVWAPSCCLSNCMTWDGHTHMDIGDTWLLLLAASLFSRRRSQVSRRFRAPGAQEAAYIHVAMVSRPSPMCRAGMSISQSCAGKSSVHYLLPHLPSKGVSMQSGASPGLVPDARCGRRRAHLNTVHGKGSSFLGFLDDAGQCWVTAISRGQPSPAVSGAPASASSPPLPCSGMSEHLPRLDLKVASHRSALWAPCPRIYELSSGHFCFSIFIFLPRPDSALQSEAVLQPTIRSNRKRAPAATCLLQESAVSSPDICSSCLSRVRVRRLHPLCGTVFCSRHEAADVLTRLTFPA